ncbi:hypothetical protein PybrP1_002845 [[Pythium] brassicae (nom. inval.)]|nr:hypothetical protein PybrP1_002845 [[Pythium] brassicae (nom. inval.)]
MAATFPELMAGIGDLYGASSARVCEAHAFALDLDALDREELALERMVQSLVARKAPQPIGAKFHRAPLPSAPLPSVSSSGRPSRRVGGDSGDAADGAEEEEDDMEEDEMEEEEAEEDEDDAFPLDERDSDPGGSSEDDPFSHELDEDDNDGPLGDESMDLEPETAATPRRETW